MTSVHYPPDCCRAAIERRVVGLADLQLLDADRLGQPLGPGYTPPPTEDQVARRMDNCDLSRETCQQYLTLHTCTKWRHGKAWLRHMERTHNKLIRDISNKSVGYEGFAYNLDDYENYYHSNGHMRISTACSAMKHNRTYGVMASAANSARDPIFYEWHSHIEDLMQQYRDKRYLPYEIEDFPLSNGLQMLEVKTIIDKEELKTENHVENMLVTFDEIGNEKLTHHREYKRINHLDFKYHIKVANPQKISKKVMVRIWLGWMGQKYLMVEMDRFVTELKSKEVEIIERKSIQSSATMKIQTTEEMYEHITNSNSQNIITNYCIVVRIKNNLKRHDLSSGCGLPHNLLVPR